MPLKQVSRGTCMWEIIGTEALAIEARMTSTFPIKNTQKIVCGVIDRFWYFRMKQWIHLISEQLRVWILVDGWWSAGGIFALKHATVGSPWPDVCCGIFVRGAGCSSLKRDNYGWTTVNTGDWGSWHFYFGRVCPGECALSNHTRLTSWRELTHGPGGQCSMSMTYCLAWKQQQPVPSTVTWKQLSMLCEGTKIQLWCCELVVRDERLVNKKHSILGVLSDDDI